MIVPWNGNARVRMAGSLEPVAATIKNNTLTFRTSKGATYILDNSDHP